MTSCSEFRRLLERALRGRPDPARPSELAWHAHLASCASCRALLESEEALEGVLATLPAPRLPKRLAERVLARLASARRGLDHLLELDAPARPPAGLRARMLGGLAQARKDARLDALLDAVPAEAPPGLAERVLAGLEAERTGAPRLRLVGRGLRYAAAAVVLFGIGFAWWRSFDRSPKLGGRPEEEREQPARPNSASAGGPLAPDEDLLAALDVLENWDELSGADVDLLLDELEAEGAFLAWEDLDTDPWEDD